MTRITATITLALLILWLGPVTGHAQGLPKFVRGNLKCAVNTNRFMAMLGRRQTHSAAAKSFLRFPRVRHPKYGDVLVTFRKGGGHNQVYDRDGMCWNPSQSKGKWDHRKCRKGGIWVRP